MESIADLRRLYESRLSRERLDQTQYVMISNKLFGKLIVVVESAKQFHEELTKQPHAIWPNQDYCKLLSAIEEFEK